MVLCTFGTLNDFFFRCVIGLREASNKCGHILVLRADPCVFAISHVFLSHTILNASACNPYTSIHAAPPL